MQNYSRPASGFRFLFDGMKLSGSPDSIPEFKYPYAQNTRSYNDSSCTSRPQIVQSQAAPATPGTVLSLEPTLGIYKIGTKILNAGVVIDTGYTDGQGCSIVPFRPNASPNAYDYIFDDAKAAKVFVPSSGAPVVSKVGIAEPQSPPDAVKDALSVDGGFMGVAAGWTNGGTAGAPADGTRTTDTVGQVFKDPASIPPILGDRYSIGVGTSQYQTGQIFTFAGNQAIIEDVFPAIAIAVPLSIQAIFYFSGNTGHCVIVPSTMPIDNVIPSFSEGDPVGATIASQTLISTLRRGSLIRLGGTETVYVWSVSKGPSNSICIETSTVNNHAAAEQIIGVPALGIHAGVVPVAGNAIASAFISTVMAAGTGFITTPFIAANNPFIHQNVVGTDTPAPQQDDYLHVSINVSDLTLLSTTTPAIRIMFDVNNGAANFTDNYYYFDVRVDDLLGAVTSTTTQLGAAQLAAQRNRIDRQLEGSDLSLTINPSRSRTLPSVIPVTNPQINSSDQTTLGTSQWTEVMFPITALTRVGNDESRTLANCQAARLQFIATGAPTIEISSFWVSNGGAQPDIGDFGILYFYRVRPRASTTGAKGNPSPSTRYGVSPRRQRVIVSLPSAAFDSQIDTWDIFRFGGEITEWRYVGSALSTASSFVDNVFDDAIVQNELLDFSNFEPFPSIGPPISTSTATVIGTTMTATFPVASQSIPSFGTLSQLGSLLPGNEFSVGNQNFTLMIRPTLVSSTPTTQTYLFQFVENAGAQTNPLVILQEPNVAAQGTNNVFGPDVLGSLFAVQVGAANNNGVGLRAGLIQRTNPNNPDGASDTNTTDLCPPSEPLQNGALLGPTPCVASTKRWWRGFPQADGSYAWNEIPVGKGLAAQLGVCSDGKSVYFVESGGISRHSGGVAQSLSDDDLYNLFPHEGIFPQDVTYAGKTVFAPEYKYVTNFRLNVVNGYLYFDYLDSTQTQRTLVCDLRKIAWSVDVYSTPISIHSGTTNPASNQLVPASAVRNQQLYFGDTSGALYNEQSVPVPAAGESVACVLVTREETVGDIRANKMFGDAAIDAIDASAVSITPVFLGTLFGTTTTLAGGQTSRPDSPQTVNLLGQQLKRSMGLFLSWTDQGVNTQLFMWQIAYYAQPEDTTNRFTDWDSAGTEWNKFFQGFILEADTLNALKDLDVRDADNLLLHDFTSNVGLNQVKANGQQTIPCSFVIPFTAHLVRLEPDDDDVWRFFGVKWIFEPCPESVLNWQTQGTSFGYNGYFHLFKCAAAYVSTAPVTLNFTLFDGYSPSTITLPSTAGQYQKVTFPFTANKGRLCTMQGVSASPWSAFLSDWTMYVREWGSSGGYESKPLIGSQHGAGARI